MAQQQPPAGGLAAAAPTFRVIRSVSGSTGRQVGTRYVFDDPRTVFSLDEDKQVTVYFEWEGPPGHHRFEGLWKNPEGRVAVVSEFEYEAKEPRFAGYWTLLLSNTLPPGIWTVEARINGEAAGTHVFQLVAAPRPDAGPPPRPYPTPSDVYRQAAQATVFIEKLDARAQRLMMGSGFFLEGGALLTSFQVIDGASNLRIHFPDGRTADTDRVRAWHRRQDWAVLDVPEAGAKTLPRAEKIEREVGDRCYSLDSPSEGSRTILDGNIVGFKNIPGAGQVWNLNYYAQRQALGSPLLDAYGDVIGLLGGTEVPGAGSVLDNRRGYVLQTGAFLAGTTAQTAVPLSMVTIPAAGIPPTTMEQLASSGEFTPPLQHAPNLMTGTLAQRVERGEGTPQPIGMASEFSLRDGSFVAFLTWYPKERQDSTIEFRLYDMDNRLILRAPPARLRLRRSEMMFSTWPIELRPPLTTGIYRVEALLGDAPVWRAYVRIAP